jgi:hypothetical protein
MHTNKNLFLIGAPKSGTSSLASWLERHSKVHLLEEKEPGFFRTRKDQFVWNGHAPTVYSSPAPDGPMMNLDSYLGLSASLAPDTWALDASTDYLSDSGSSQAIFEFSKTRDVKLVCILRDPVERSFSEYQHTVRDGLEPLTFVESLHQEGARVEAQYQPLFFHMQRSRYFESVSRYRDLFGKDLLILDYGDLSDAPAMAGRIFNHLGISHEDLGDPGRLNPSDRDEYSANSPLRRLLRKVQERVTGRTPQFSGSNSRADQRAPLSDEARDLVLKLLEDDIASCVADAGIPTDDWVCLRHRGVQRRR